MNNMLVPLTVLLFANAVYSWNSCADESFCNVIRNQEDYPVFTVDVNSVSNDGEVFTASLSDGENEQALNLTISAIEEDIFRIVIDDPSNPRTAIPQTLDGEPVKVPITVSASDDGDIVISSGDQSLHLQASPFKISVYSSDSLILVINDRGKMVYTPGTSNKAVAMDFSFPETQTAYGIPLHAESFELQNTGPGGLNPYKLYNVDHCCYENYIQDSLYGAHPVLYAHGVEQSTAVFWLNAAQTYVDINKSGANGVESYFISEGGLVDIFVLTGPTFKRTIAQYIQLTGKAPLPQLFTLGYHQSRWSYATQEDAETVVREMDEYEFAFDAIWFDVDYMDDKISFTWNYTAFPDPVGMQNFIESTGRKVILIIDPHYKVQEGYYVYDEGAAEGFFVKYANGSDFVGEGWPGPSVWWDYINPRAAEHYSTFYSKEKFANTTDIVYIWNDMNEPEVFDGFERSWNRSLVFHDEGRISNIDVHNIFSFSQVRSTFNGYLARNDYNKRPYILTRSHFSGSHRYAGTWTGDNNSTWEHLQINYPMCLSLSIVGMSYCGADIGGFAGNLTEELYERWYQAGAWLPFYRAHSNQYYERREPYLYSEEAQTRIRNAIKQRYEHLPVWYTLFYELERTGEPVARPLVYEYPSDANVFSIDNQWLIGDDILIHPVSDEGVSSVQIYFPGGEDVLWYDSESGVAQSGVAQSGVGYVEVDVTRESIPVYYKGGSIIVKKEIYRRSTVDMASDPYTIHVYLDSNGEASGTLYFDDYESFDYRNNIYNYYQLSATDSELSIQEIDADAGYTGEDLTIESVVIYESSGASRVIGGGRKGQAYKIVKNAEFNEKRVYKLSLV